MKKGLVIVLLLVAMNVWGQSYWIYDRQWGGRTTYEGSGRGIFDYIADLHNNYSNGSFHIIERPSNDQINVIKYGLQQHTVRINDVYTVLLINRLTNRSYDALVIITGFPSNGVYSFSYYLWEF